MLGEGEGDGGGWEGGAWFLPARKAEAVMPRPWATRIDVFDDMSATIDGKKMDMQWWNGELRSW